MSQDRGPSSSQRPTVPVMPSWVIWVGAVMFPLLALGLMGLLLLHFGSGTPQDRIQLDVIKTAGGIVVGTGGAIALLLNARRQRSAELALRLQDADIAQKELAAVDTRHDATERRITELYNAAVEQLGSDKAPVRLGGLYALERLAQDNPGHRPTVVEVLCAYLRMPDPDEPLDIDELKRGNDAEQGRKQRREEHQVRRAAQHVLIRHLRPSADEGNASLAFWPGIELDLNGATLHNWDFSGCWAKSANFSKTRFRGWRADFSFAEFGKRVLFDGARFYCFTSFSNAEFAQFATFSDSTFFDAGIFDDADFYGDVAFDRADFRAMARFSRVDIHGNVMSFMGTSFHAAASFGMLNGMVSIADKMYIKKGQPVAPLPPGGVIADIKSDNDPDLEEWQIIVQDGWVKDVP